jgi:hypothetical protein
MSLSSCTRETFDDSGTRHNDMYSTIKTWLENLVEQVDDAISSEQFKQGLDAGLSPTIAVLTDNKSVHYSLPKQ